MSSIRNVGDQLLRQLFETLASIIRSSDIACRYGGEEFVLILPEASLESTTQRTEQLWRAVKKIRVRHAGKLVEPMTLSIGVAVSPHHGATPAALLRTVDEALLRAKAEGRDRVVAAGN